MKCRRGRSSLSFAALVTGLALSGTLFAFSSPAIAATTRGPAEHSLGGGALFVQTDSPSGNQILAYNRNRDGQLTETGIFSTGGKGSVAAGSAVDPLASQGSLTLASQGQVLLAVNGGSDTVSVFRVSGTALSLSEVVPSGGEVPSSIAVHGNLVYVLNSGGAGSVQGFILFNARLLPLPNSNRSLGLDNTTPPFFLDAPGQVGITPDGRQLIVTTKESGNDIDIFSLDFFGIPSSEPVVNPAAAPIPFAFTFDSAGHLVVTDAGSSALTSYKVNQDGTVTPLGTAGDGQAALCWVTDDDGYFYGSNAGSANVSLFVLGWSGAPRLVGTAALTTGGGATDSAVTPDGRFLYVEEGGAGTVDEFQVGSGGYLTLIGELSGLQAPMEGIAAS